MLAGTTKIHFRSVPPIRSKTLTQYHPMKHCHSILSYFTVLLTSCCYDMKASCIVKIIKELLLAPRFLIFFFFPNITVYASYHISDINRKRIPWATFQVWLIVDLHRFTFRKKINCLGPSNIRFSQLAILLFKQYRELQNSYLHFKKPRKLNLWRWNAYRNEF